jgi:hypothetical protein
LPLNDGIDLLSVKGRAGSALNSIMATSFASESLILPQHGASSPNGAGIVCQKAKEKKEHEGHVCLLLH